MSYSFSAYGHKNILSTHKTTIEFTKDKELTTKGNCIVGVNSNFKLNSLKNFIKKNKDKKIELRIKVDKIEDTITGYLNPSFNDNKEMVIRKSDFISKRTLIIKANKAAFDLNKKLINKLKQENKIKITISTTQ